LTAPPVSSRLIPIVRRDDRPVCVMLPGLGGGLVPYLRLGAYLGQAYNVYAIRAAGLMPDEEPEAGVPEMADGVLRVLDGIVPDVVFGWSMGGTVAWEVCTALARRGHRPDLVMVDSSPFRLEPDKERNDRTLDVIIGMLGTRPDQSTLQRLTRTYRLHLDALIRFEVRDPYDGRVLLLTCAGESANGDRARAVARWRTLVPSLRTGTLAADHFGVFDPAHLPPLSAAIGEFLGMPHGVSG
jgi:surfactin synthase thioesterase subunit